MRILTLVVLAMLTATGAWASASRYLDGQFITNGANTLTIPAATDTLVGRATSESLTNKTMSGASNSFSAIPVGAIGGGSVLSGTNTGDVTASAFGASPNANGFTLTGQALNLQPADATHPGGLLAADWVLFNAKLTSPMTTLGDIIFEDGTPAAARLAGNTTTVKQFLSQTGTGTVSAAPAWSALAAADLAVAVVPSTSGNVLTSNGSTWTSAALPSGAPALNGGSASPQSVTAVGGVSLTGIGYQNMVWVAGSAGAVTVTATPSITACTADGQVLKVFGTSNTNTVKLQDQANLASSGLSMNGDIVLAKDSSITFHCDITQGLWVEDSRR